MSTYHSLWNWNGFFAALDTSSYFKYCQLNGLSTLVQNVHNIPTIQDLWNNKILIYLLIHVPITSFAIIASKVKVCAMKWRGIIEKDKGKIRAKPPVYYGLQRTEMKRKAGTDSQIEDNQPRCSQISSLRIWGYTEGVSKSRLQGWYGHLKVNRHFCLNLQIQVIH